MTESPARRTTRLESIEAASDWVIRLHQRELPDSEIEAWTGWINQNVDHARAFDDVLATWETLDHLSESYPRDHPAGDTADDYDGSVPILSWRAKRPSAGVKSVAPPRWPRLTLLAAGLAAAAIVVLMATHSGELGNLLPATSTVTAPLVLGTDVGGRRSIALDDGSRVELGAASTVRLDLSDRERQVELLSGVAYFTVVHDAARPFTVYAGGAAARALGTRFSVAHRGDGVAVAVTEGRVAVGRVEMADSGAKAYPATAVEVRSGQAIGYSPADGVEQPTTIDVDDVTSWLRGTLVYRREPLSRVLYDLNRYSSLPIEAPEPAIAHLKVTGRWVTSDVDGWLAGLTKALPITLHRRGDRIVILPRSHAMKPIEANTHRQR